MHYDKDKKEINLTLWSSFVYKHKKDQYWASSPLSLLDCIVLKMFAKGVRIQALFDNDHALNIRYLAQPLGKFVIC